jgi:lysophospholipase L1-like esterase
MIKLIGKSLTVIATCFVAARSSNILTRTVPTQTPTPDSTTVDIAASLLLNGLHPSATGYAKMWAVIAPLLNESLP